MAPRSVLSIIAAQLSLHLKMGSRNKRSGLVRLNSWSAEYASPAGGESAARQSCRVMSHPDAGLQEYVGLSAATGVALRTGVAPAQKTQKERATKARMVRNIAGRSCSELLDEAEWGRSEERR